MLEVSARLLGRSVFLAGETVECQVVISNVGKHKPDGSPSRSNKAVKLAWASAQIHCQCSVSESRVTFSSANLLPTNPGAIVTNETSFVPNKGERGTPVISTKPVILVCDLTIAPRQRHTFLYRETLPLEAPPSFRGAAVKYSYKITIGTQRLGCMTRLLRVPFIVLVVRALQDIPLNEEENGRSADDNPFRRHQDNGMNLLDVALDWLQTATCRKSSNFFNVANSRGPVARFCMFKQAYRIGDDIIGTCDFTEGSVPCVELSVSLQSEEQVVEHLRRKNGQTSTVTSYSKQREFCLHISRTHICVPIPLTATPGFTSDLVSLRWRLHFEFVTCKAPLEREPSPACDSEGCGWQGPHELDVETTVWDMPIHVYATNPQYASSVSLLQTEATALV